MVIYAAVGSTVIEIVTGEAAKQEVVFQGCDEAEARAVAGALAERWASEGLSAAAVEGTAPQRQRLAAVA